MEISANIQGNSLLDPEIPSDAHSFRWMALVSVVPEIGGRVPEFSHRWICPGCRIQYEIRIGVIGASVIHIHRALGDSAASVFTSPQKKRLARNPISESVPEEIRAELALRGWGLNREAACDLQNDAERPIADRPRQRLVCSQLGQCIVQRRNPYNGAGIPRNVLVHLTVEHVVYGRQARVNEVFPPIVSSFCQLNALVKSSPWENRLVAFICSPSYQVLPSGA